MKTKNLAKSLKDFRTLRGMSQEYLADQSRVSLRTIQRIENNESTPTGETIKRIANALDVELSELTGSSSVAETSDLKATIIFLKRKLSKTDNKSEVNTFEKFIDLLNKLKEKKLNPEQLEGIESYIKYLELEKIPSFSNEMFKKKMVELKKHLKNKLRFVPNNHYTIIGITFAIPFSIGFGITDGITMTNKIIVISAVLSLIAIGIIMDIRIKKQQRSFSF